MPKKTDTQQHDVHIFGAKGGALRVEMVAPKKEKNISPWVQVKGWAERHPWPLRIILGVLIALLFAGLFLQNSDVYHYHVQTPKLQPVHSSLHVADTSPQRSNISAPALGAIDESSIPTVSVQEPFWVSINEPHELRTTIFIPASLTRTLDITATMVITPADSLHMRVVEGTTQVFENVSPGNSISFQTPFQISAKSGADLPSIGYALRIETGPAPRMVLQSSPQMIHPSPYPMNTFAHLVGAVVATLTSSAWLLLSPMLIEVVKKFATG